MRKLVALATLLLVLAACETPERGQQSRLMDQIEERVQLPKGAGSLSQYARYYAYGEAGRILGVYITPSPEIPSDALCEELKEDFTSQPVPCSSFPEPQWTGIVAGQRQWLENYRLLPLISDGGCSVVNVIFNPSTRTVEQVVCNGLA